MSPPDSPPARSAVALALGAATLTAWAPLLSLHERGLAGAFEFLAGDVFYYLAVARHSAEAGFFTLDGSHPVNGFHPLWQAFLRFSFSLLSLDGRGQLLYALCASIGFTAAGTACFAAAALRLTRSPSLALLAAVPGYYYALAPAANPEVRGRWSSINGMESPLSVLWFGLLVYGLLARGWLARDAPASRLLPLSLLLALALLTRLDDVFLVLPFIAWAALAPADPGQRLPRLAALGALPALALAGAVLFNLSLAGSPLPLSGASKFGGLEGLARNGYATLTTLLPFADLRSAGLDLWGRESWRVLQMLLPALGALAWLGWRRPAGLGWRDRSALAPSDTASEQRLALSLLATYVLLKAAYNFCFVPLWQQGQWYYPVSVMVFDLLVACALGEALRAWAQRPRARWIPLAWGALIAVAASGFASDLASVGRHVRYRQLFERSPEVSAALARGCPGCGLLSFDDGIIAWALPVPTMNGLGLMMDREAWDARAEGRLLELAHARGHRVLATLNYPFNLNVQGGDLGAALGSYPYLAGQDLSAWHFSLLHRDAPSRTTFLRFEPR
jgi:hypothetical protein